MGNSIGIVAREGLDLSSLLDSVVAVKPFSEVPGLPPNTAWETAGRFIFGRCGSCEVIIQQGRFHFYEGYSYSEVVRPVEALFQWGCSLIVFTNAAGGLMPGMNPGELLAITECVVFPPDTPIRCWPGAQESTPTTTTVTGCAHSGKYLWVSGPSYETAAEIQLMQRLGGSAVGMSTAPELQRCDELGIGSAAIACITNSCCDAGPVQDGEVLRAAAKASTRLTSVLRSFLEEFRM